MPVMLANWASCVAAVSTFMFVAMSSPVTVDANSCRLSFEIPSCAPSASALRIVSAVTGWDLDASSAASPNSCSSSLVRSAVLLRLASAVSNVSACVTQ